jgi:hypothetical protein
LAGWRFLGLLVVAFMVWAGIIGLAARPRQRRVLEGPGAEVDDSPDLHESGQASGRKFRNFRNFALIQAQQHKISGNQRYLQFPRNLDRYF